MKKKNILSALLSITMLASTFTGLTASAEKTTSGTAPEGLPSNWVKIYGEDFEDYVKDPLSMAEDSIFEIEDGNGEIVNTDWKYWGKHETAYPAWETAQIGEYNGNKFIRRKTVGRRTTGMKLAGLDALPEENQVEFDLGALSANKNDASRVFARINMSADGKSYYEIGHAGDTVESTAPLGAADGTPIIVKHTNLEGVEKTYDYPVWYTKTTTTTDTDGNVVGEAVTEPKGEHYRFTLDTANIQDSKVTNEDGTTTTVTYNVSGNGDYQGKSYFKMVKDGVVTYSKWGNGDSGTQGVFNNDWVHVTLKTTADGVAYEMMPSESYDFNGAEEKPFLSGICTDTSLAGTGIPFMFGTGGHEGGVRLDNLAIYSEPLPEWKTWTDDFSEDQPRLTGSTGNIGNWSVTETSGTGWAEISNGALKTYNHSNNKISVRPNSFVAQNLPVKNIIKAKLSQFGNYGTNGNWYLHATIGMKFAVSEDGKSYYEIGKTGSSFGGGLRLEQEGTDGVPSDTEPSDTIYTYRRYFRKVVDGVTTYIKWDTPLSTDWYARWMVGALTLSGFDRYGDVTITNTADSVTWSYIENGNEFSGKLVDASPLARVGAPIEFAKFNAQNQAYAIRDFSITYDAKDLPTPPSFTDDFKNYTADNAVTADNKWLLTDGEKVLATGTNSDGHKWQYVTSTKWNGSYAAGISGDAYISTSAKTLAVRGRGEWAYGSVKLDLGEGVMKSFEKVQAKAVSFDRMGMLNAFVNGDESSFITFGLRADVGNGMGIGVKNRLPVVALHTGNSWQILAQAVQNEETGAWSYTCADGVTANIDAAWTKYNDWNGSYNTTWTIEVKSDNSAAFTAECANGGKVTGTISADIVKPLLDTMRYPAAFMGAGDGWASFADLSVWYTKDEAVLQPQISDNFRDYTAENAVTEAYSFVDGKKVIAAGTNDEGYKWQYVTSKVWNGDYLGNKTVSGDARINLQDRTLTFRGRGNGADGAVNFDLGNGAVKSVEKVNVKVNTQTRMGAVNLFVSNDEKSFIAFGNRNEINNPSTIGVTDNRYPTVALFINGTRTVLARAVKDSDTNTWGYTCEDGVTAVMEKDFGNSATPIDWTITVNEDGSLNYVAKGDNGGVVTGTVAASIVSPIMSNFRYPMSFKSGGDGWSKVSKVRLWYTPNEEYEEPLFYDDFDSYKNDDATITQNDTETGVKSVKDGVSTEGTYKGHRLASGPAVLATHEASGAKWITSGVWTATYGDVNQNLTVYPGQAYINTSAKALQVLGCNFPHIAAVNLDMGENKKFAEMHKATFTMSAPPRNAGVRLFVSGNEKYFLEFGFTGGEESRYGKENGEVRAPFSPMIRKSVNPGVQADSRYWTSSEMNNYKDSVIYDWSVYGTVGNNTGVDNENTTIETTQAWMGQDKTITYTITIREDGTVEWDAKGSAGGHSSGVIDDEQVKELIHANWVYPAAFASGGDGNGTLLSEIALYGTTEDVSFDTMYEKREYSQSEFGQMYKEADYGRDAQVEALLKLDLSDVIGDEKGAVDVTVTAENDNTAKNVLTGTHYEFGDNYDMFYDENGNLKDSYKTWAKSQSPISTLRLGGGSSDKVNMWNDLNGLDSTYISFPASKRYKEVEKVENGETVIEQVDKIGTTSTKAYKMGVAKTIQAFKANNPNMSFVLAVSPYTTSAEDVGKLVKALIGTDDDSKLFRSEKFGSSTPINLYAIELGNEIDYGKGMEKHADLIGWYLDISNAMIDQIKANDPDNKVKIIACGPTAPWGSDSDWGSLTSAKKWVAQLADGTDDGQHKGIANRIDAMAFHAYYYGINPENVLEGYAKPLYDVLAGKGYGNVKLSMTEHAVFWHAENNYYATPMNSSLFGGLGNAYFIVKAANGGYTDSGFNHSTVGTSGMYSRWQYSNTDKAFHANPVTTAYNVLSDAWSDEGIYKTDINVTNDVTDAYQNAPTSRRFEATTVKVSDDTINLILVNNQGYTPVDANIKLPAEFKDFKLTKEVTYTAPNMFSFMFNANTADLAEVNTVEYDTPEVFGSRVYTVPNKSMVILTLSGNASLLLKDEFNYSDTDAIESERQGDVYIAKEIAANKNGTKWLTSVANIGNDEQFASVGNAKISNGALVVNSNADSVAKMGANWDISGYKEVPNGINKITFTTTNTNATGGVMLFVKTTGTEDNPVEKSKFDFSNELCGFNGTVDWTVTIANNVLTWTAVSASSTVPKTGTMPITDEEMNGYDFLAQVYVNASTTGSGSVALEKIDVSYGADAPEVKNIISYEKGTDALNITVDPSAASTEISVWVGYYSNGKLVKVIPGGNYAAGAEKVAVSADLPTDGQTAKIFAWQTISGAEPVQGSITVE